MQRMVESTSRRPTDYFHFGITFFGLIIGIGGVITVSIAASVCGLAMVALGVAYFLVENLTAD
jgi:hypothetical protein